MYAFSLVKRQIWHAKVNPDHWHNLQDLVCDQIQERCTPSALNVSEWNYAYLLSHIPREKTHFQCRQTFVNFSFYLSLSQTWLHVHKIILVSRVFNYLRHIKLPKGHHLIFNPLSGQFSLITQSLERCNRLIISRNFILREEVNRESLLDEQMRVVIIYSDLYHPVEAFRTWLKRHICTYLYERLFICIDDHHRVVWLNEVPTFAVKSLQCNAAISSIFKLFTDTELALHTAVQLGCNLGWWT